MKKKIRYITVLLFIILLLAVIVFIYVKVNHQKTALESGNELSESVSISEALVDSVYVYHSDIALPIDQYDPMFHQLLVEAVRVAKPALNEGNTMDGSLIFDGGGKKFSSNEESYYLEMELKEPKDINSSIKTYKGIKKIVFDTQEYGFYLFDSDEEQSESIVLFEYMGDGKKDELQCLLEGIFAGQTGNSEENDNTIR